MAVKTPKVSLKSLQSEVNIFKDLLKNTTKELFEVKEELNHVKKEVNKLKANDFVQKIEQTIGSETNEKCRICDKTFNSRIKLRRHYIENHRQKIKCKLCDETFEKNCDLEEHIKINHQSAECFKCEECDKDFVLKWRLKKHQESHISKSVKKCHYFNNNKQCPFENIGCMFIHSVSDTCMYGNNCTKKMCSFQHKKDDSKGKPENEEDDCKDKMLKDFEKLSDDLQYESREVLCDYICAAPNGYHKCFSDEDYARFIGCNLAEYDDDYDIVKHKSIEYFPCESCGEKFEEYDNLSKHFNKNHEQSKSINCPIDCDYKTKSVEVLVMHIGIKHQNVVRRKLEEDF